VAGRKKSHPKKAPGSSPGLGSAQWRELLALALLALALFLLLALVPVSALGSRVGAIFPSGNAIGRVGVTTAEGMWTALGAAAVLIPALLLLGGLRAGGWLGRETALRLGALSIGLLLFVPPGLYVVVPDSQSDGWLGRVLGGPLVSALSWLGSLLLLSVLVVALLVVTLGWQPMRAVGQGVALGGGAVGRGMGFLVNRWTRWRSERACREEAAAVLWTETNIAPLEPFERETGDEGPEPGQGASAPGESGHSRKSDIPAVLPTQAQASDPFADRADKRTLETPLPPLNILTPGALVDRSHMDEELDRLGQVLVEKLRTFNVESHIGGRTTGPVVTQFEVVPAPGVKVNRIANLEADLALAMKAQSVRIVAPIPGKGAVGVEIPNPEAAVVQLREILEAKEFRSARGNLPLAMGKDLTGKAYVADLAKMPHILIAGATGSGKSVCINTVITSLVYRHTPETLRLLMIDPKMVELSAYSELPHLRHPVVTDPRDAAGVLKWAVLEMERRYELLSTNHVRSITEFNQKTKAGVVLRRVRAEGDEGDENRWIYDDGVLPYIVVVVDELADLMMTVQSEVERPLSQLAQKARAIGIHLIVATQRPSVNVITGLIKANFPTRVAFRVASKTDSRTILDQNGSEALLGNGDMLFLPPGKSEPARIQGAFISTEDTEALLNWYRHGREALDATASALVSARSEADILEEVRASEQLEETDAEEISSDWDELFRDAAEVCIRHQQGSTSLLQRRLKIGYGRAARIVDQLHEAGVVGPPDGSKPREVLVSLSEITGMFPGI
jgi:S-DNA-T family DNA segregation ATPase FtsK/SpoIIIE